jgi:soluble lytic murein transglycosylase-like protein
MKRKTFAATIAVQIALVSASPIRAASNDDSTSSVATASDSDVLGAGLARLRAAMAHALPGHSESLPESPSARLAPLPDSRCKDGAVAPEIVKKMVEDEAARQQVDAKLATAIAEQESNFGERVNSPASAAAGAMGVMQLRRETANRYGVSDPCDVADNIRGGVSFIKDLSAQFGGNVFLIFAAYNAGEKRVYAAKGVPPISETVRYVAAAANAYYDLPNALNAARRPPREVSGASSADASAPQQDSVGQKWIGGTVLYVEQEK